MSYTPYLLLLCCLGTAITVQAQDCAYPVGGENMELSDEDINTQIFPDGSEVIFQCKPGYRPETSAFGQIVCTAGIWSPVLLKCGRRSCGSAGTVDNGNIDYPTGVLFGDEAVITCNEGFQLVGKSKLTCGIQGWLGRLPECEVVTCGEPPRVTDATYSPIKESYEYGDPVQYSCNGDLVLNGSQSLSCDENGTFMPEPPVCVSVKCAELKVLNAEWIGGARFPYKHGDSVTLQCFPGYVMTGPSTIVCGINSEWTPNLPSCKLRVTTTTKATPKATTTTTDPSITKDPAGNGGNLPMIMGVLFGVIGLAALTALGCYCFGVPECLKGKRGTRKESTGNGATKDGADIALSEPLSC